VLRLFNYNDLLQELLRVRETALGRDGILESEIYETYELVNELTSTLWLIDQIYEAMDFKRAIEIGRRFEFLASRLFSLDSWIKRLFTSEDTTVTWRGATVKNIVHVIEGEARLYVSYLEPFLSSDVVKHIPEELEDDLIILRTQIRLRIAKDGNQESTVPGHEDSPKGRSGTEHYLGLLFHDDLTVSRLGDKYRDVGTCVISLSPQQFKILKFIHDAGEKGRTKSEMDAQGFTSLKQEKTKINEKLIPIDLRFKKGEHKLIHIGNIR
jgi:hypothetical protein